MHRWPWQRQMADPLRVSDGVWSSGGCFWHIASELPEGVSGASYDYWVTWDEPWKGRIRRDIPLDRRVLLITEPREYKDYGILLPLHGVIVTPYDLACRLPAGSRQIFAPPLINWFYGVDTRGAPVSTVNLAGIEAMPVPEKTGLCSIVCSDIGTLPAHRERVLFFRTLRTVFKDRIDCFGRGHAVIPDKKDAVDRYKYVICLENNLCERFWTEKAADAFLGHAMPVYCGCPDFGKWFPEDSFARIDFRQPDRAMRVIDALLREDPWKQRLPAIMEARRRLLRDYNFFTALPRLLDALPALRQGILSEKDVTRRYLSGGQ
jgi:hypothetical protein